MRIRSAALLVVVSLAVGCSPAPAHVDELLALQCARHFIGQQLVAPATATWASALWDDARQHATQGSDGSWTVRSWVDSENRFGAKIRTQYMARMSIEPNGSYRVIEWQLE